MANAKLGKEMKEGRVENNSEDRCRIGFGNRWNRESVKNVKKTDMMWSIC